MATKEIKTPLTIGKVHEASVDLQVVKEIMQHVVEEGFGYNTTDDRSGYRNRKNPFLDHVKISV